MATDGGRWRGPFVWGACVFWLVVVAATAWLFRAAAVPPVPYDHRLVTGASGDVTASKRATPSALDAAPPTPSAPSVEEGPGSHRQQVCTESTRPRRRPDILLLLADDLGWNEVGYHNSSRGLHTPNLDRLSATGVRLTQHYALPLCSPTRAALFTGRHPHRYGLQNGLLYFDTPWCVPQNETFFPMRLREAGYHTAMFGKWHLGFMHDWCMPNARGFEEHVGFLQGMSTSYRQHTVFAFGRPRGAYDWMRNGKTDFRASGIHTVELLTTEAVNYLERMSESPQPLFMMLSYQAKDVAVCDAGELKGDPVCGLVHGLDESVGLVVEALERTRGLCNALIVFSSDNGGQDGQRDTRNYPLRGWKGESWEGGTRVPAFVWWGWGKQQSRVSDELYHVTDWFPTLLGLGGANLTGGFEVDGVDIWESIAGALPSPRTSLLYNVKSGCGRGVSNRAAAAYREGPFKLVVKHVGSRRRRRQKGGSRCGEKRMLFDVDTDPRENHDLLGGRGSGGVHAGVLARLTSRLAEYREQSAAPLVLDAPWQCPPLRPLRVQGRLVWSPSSQ